MVRYPFCVFSLTLVAACGGGGGSSNGDGTQAPSAPPLEPDDAIGGLYDARLSNTVTGIQADLVLAIAEDGEFHAFGYPAGPYDEYYIHGELDVDGSSFSGTGTQIAPAYTSGIYLDEEDRYASSVQIRISGDVVEERIELQGTFDLQGGSDRGSILAQSSPDLQARYQADSSFSAIAGTYQDEYTYSGLGVIIDGNGGISSNTPGCSINGRATPIDSRYNLYEIAAEVAGCSDFIPGTYEGMGAVWQVSGVKYLIVTGDNGEDAFFAYELTRQ